MYSGGLSPCVVVTAQSFRVFTALSISLSSELTTARTHVSLPHYCHPRTGELMAAHLPMLGSSRW